MTCQLFDFVLSRCFDHVERNLITFDQSLFRVPRILDVTVELQQYHLLTLCHAFHIISIGCSPIVIRPNASDELDVGKSL